MVSTVDGSIFRSIPSILARGGGVSGYPNGNDIQYSYSTATASAYLGGYFQDDWKVSTKLTVNLGIRYDVDIPRTERYNRLSYFDINAPSPLQGKVQSSAICPTAAI